MPTDSERLAKIKQRLEVEVATLLEARQRALRAAETLIAANGEKRREVATLRQALERSVKLQSHYATLLNMYDGGKRIVFNTSQEWLDQLKELDNDKQ